MRTLKLALAVVCREDREGAALIIPARAGSDLGWGGSSGG